MKKYILIGIFTTIFLFFLNSCQHKELCQEDSFAIRLSVNFEWDQSPEANPTDMMLYLFRENGKPLYYQFTNSKGGEITIPPGVYKAICYNGDSESILFRGDATFEGFEAYTSNTHLLTPMGFNESPKTDLGVDENIAIEPDRLWYDSDDGISFTNCQRVATITFHPKRVVTNYSFKIENVKNLKYTKKMSASLSGLSGSFLLGEGMRANSATTIPFKANKNEKENTISGDFLCFGTANIPYVKHYLIIYVMLADGKKWYYRFDVTDQIRNAPDPYSIHIIIDDLQLPQPIANGEGFSPSVDDWEDIRIDLPM